MLENRDVYDIPLNTQENDPLNIILNKIQPGSVVLEFGPAHGRMTQFLYEVLKCSVYIVELDPVAFEDANKYAEQGICGNILEYQWLDDFSDIEFDYLIFADVLEHLPDPTEVIAKAKAILKDNGSVWVSVPNIAHNDILLNLYSDVFHYTSTGLLDETHIHFFAYEELDGFAKSGGFEIVYEDAVICEFQNSEQGNKNLIPELFAETLKRRPMGQIYEFVFELKKQEHFEQEKLEKTSLVKQKNDSFCYRIYFDFGEGFSAENRIETFEKEMFGEFKYDVLLPAGTKILRFDPGRFRTALIKSFKASSPSDTLGYSTNGFLLGDYNVFLNRNDPQFFIDVDGLGGSWITLSGKCVNPDSIESEILVDLASDYTLNQNHNIGLALQNKRDLNGFLTEQGSLISKLREELDLANIQLSETNIQFDETKIELDKTNIQLDEIKIEMQNIQGALRKRLKLANSNQTEISKLKLENANLRKAHQELSNLRNKYHELSKIHSEVVNSKAWKMSKPYRFVGSGIKRLFKTGDSSSVSGQSNSTAKTAQTRREMQIWDLEQSKGPENPLVSIIVPNYNHSQYLKQRLDSIYQQTYKNFEVILLDDCSTDDSQSVLLEYANRYQSKTRYLFNETNSGRVFSQWKTGIELAKGEYIWIAESDDYCSENLLEELVPLMSYQSVMLAFARTVFMKKGVQFWTIEEYLKPLGELDFTQPFAITAHEAVSKGFARKNIVPNVSSALFRNTGSLPTEMADLWDKVSLVHDWLMYLSIIKGGSIAYTNTAINYYRVHDESTSKKVQATSKYYQEFETVSKYVAKNYKVNPNMWQVILSDLKKHYAAQRKTDETKLIETYYRIPEIKHETKSRKPNIAMCIYSMQVGGGETIPLFLASELKRKGLSVAVFNFDNDIYEQVVRSQLDVSVPLVNLNDQKYLTALIDKYGIDIIHSHHASIDSAVSDALYNTNAKVGSVVTLHGMYEATTKLSAERAINKIAATCSHFVYTADKNVERFKEFGYFDETRFTKLTNALPVIPINPVDRKELSLNHEDFVLCHASRAIPTKGWKEAVEIVNRANEKSNRRIQLLLIGEGEAADELKNCDSEYVHFLKNTSNIRDYISMSDVFFFPTRFPGESYPLVVIDALLSGRPIVSSNIGEIANMITSKEGAIAGVLFDLMDWELPIESVVDIIVELANNECWYNELRSNVSKVSSKFDISLLVDSYLNIYSNALNAIDREESF